MTERLLMLACAGALLAALAACSEKVQTATPRNVDQKAWQGVDNPFAVPGWKAGDKTSWEADLRTRTQTQNEYNRVK
jgi:hypothetical protein